MIIDAVRSATRNYHTELDHLVYPLIQKTVLSSDYIRLLRMFYGYVMPVYSLTDLYLNDNLVGEYSLRRKPDRILDDIDFFDKGEKDLIPFCTDLPFIDNVSSAYGAFYVLEGSTLGGKIIREKLSSNLHLQPENGFSYFSGYGEDNGRMWNIFLTSLENFAENGADEKVLIESAQNTFLKFTNWVKQSQHEFN